MSEVLKYLKQDKIKQLAKNKFIQGGAIYTVATFVVNFFSYLFNSLSAKALGPSMYGEVVSMFSYLYIFTVPSGIASALIIRRLGQEGKLRRKFAIALEQWFIDKVLRWKFIFILLVPLLFILPKLTNLMWISSLVLLLTFVSSVFTTFYSSALQGLQLFVVFSLVNVGASLTTLLGPVLVFLGVDGLYTMFVFILLGGVVPVLVGRKVLKKLARQDSKLGELSQLNKRIVHILQDRKVIVSILSILSVTVLGNVSVIYVKKFFPAEVAGIYSAWILFARIIYYFSAPVTTIAYIFFSDKEQSKEKKIYLVPITCLFVLLSGSLYFVYRYFGRWLLLFVFDMQYLDVLSLMPSAAFFGFFYTLISVFNGFFVAKESNFALINVFTIPLYLLSLYYFGGQEILKVVNVNIIYTLAITAAYTIALFRQK